MATAIASSHIRIRRHSPKLTMSLIAPIVQKLLRCAAAPNMNASPNASQTTMEGSDDVEFIRRLSHGRTPRPSSPFLLRKALTLAPSDRRL
jgi:hypothetical protein